MATSSISETKRVQYLLGLCSPAEREHIESEYFENEDAFQEMLTAEDDLIDAYARGELTGEERRGYEKRFGSSLRGRNRLQFARAFAGAISTHQPVRTTLPGSVLYTFQSPGLLRTAMIAGAIVLVAMLAWLVIDRTRLTNELRELRAESAELSKRTEALHRSSDNEQTRTDEIAAQLAEMRSQPDRPRHRERVTIANQRAGELPGVKNDREKIASSKTKRPDKVLITQDASLGKTLTTTQIPILGRKFENLLSPPPETPRSSGSATIRGIATAQNDNPVSGANVTLSDSVRNFSRTQSTNKDGAYVFTAVPPGTYSIEVNAPGFKTFLASGLAVLVDTPAVMDAQLEIGAMTETVSVIAGAEAPIKLSDATIGNVFEARRITELPLNANNVVGLLSLQPGVTSTGFVNGGRSDQATITLYGVDVNERPSLTPFNISSSGETNIHIPSSLSWIRFQITLEKPLTREDYRVTIETADGRPVTSVDWSEPLTPNQTIMDTPAISTADLPSANYVLLLMGKEPDGSFVKVAEYFFEVIRY